MIFFTRLRIVINEFAKIRKLKYIIEQKMDIFNKI